MDAGYPSNHTITCQSCQIELPTFFTAQCGTAASLVVMILSHVMGRLGQALWTLSGDLAHMSGG